RAAGDRALQTRSSLGGLAPGRSVLGSVAGEPAVPATGCGAQLREAASKGRAVARPPRGLRYPESLLRPGSEGRPAEAGTLANDPDLCCDSKPHLPVPGWQLCGSCSSFLRHGRRTGLKSLGPCDAMVDWMKVTTLARSIRCAAKSPVQSCFSLVLNLTRKA